MATIAFRQLVDFMTGQVRTDMIQYRDETATVWSIPEGHRIWNDVYEPWLAAGNTPLTPGAPWPSP